MNSSCGIRTGIRRITAVFGFAGIALVSIVGAPAHATAILTAAATAAGFTLSTFVSGIPMTPQLVGPVGLVNTTGGNIMVTGYGDVNGKIRVFTDVDGHTWTDGAASTTSYGQFNPAGLATVGGKFYLARQQPNGGVVEIDSAGNFVQDIVSFGFATGIVGNPSTGHLYVANLNSVIDLDPIAKTFDLFVNQGADGISLSSSGILYMAIPGTGHVLGFDTGTHGLVFDSGFIPGAPDGTVLGAGGLAGNIYVVTNGNSVNTGQVIQINLATHAQTVIVTGGSRGDLAIVDANDGTMLFTQSSEVLRLTAPPGSEFEGRVPEPATLGLLGLGLTGLGFARRRKR